MSLKGKILSELRKRLILSEDVVQESIIYIDLVPDRKNPEFVTNIHVHADKAHGGMFSSIAADEDDDLGFTFKSTGPLEPGHMVDAPDDEDGVATEFPDHLPDYEGWQFTIRGENGKYDAKSGGADISDIVAEYDDIKPSGKKQQGPNHQLFDKYQVFGINPDNVGKQPTLLGNITTALQIDSKGAPSEGRYKKLGRKRVALFNQLNGHADISICQKCHGKKQEPTCKECKGSGSVVSGWTDPQPLNDKQKADLIKINAELEAINKSVNEYKKDNKSGAPFLAKIKTPWMLFLDWFYAALKEIDSGVHRAGGFESPKSLPPTNEQCSACGGMKVINGVKCKKCDGLGLVPNALVQKYGLGAVNPGQQKSTTICGECSGSGKTDDGKACSECEGSGKVESTGTPYSYWVDLANTGSADPDVMFITQEQQDELIAAAKKRGIFRPDNNGVYQDEEKWLQSAHIRPGGEDEEGNLII